MMLQNQARALSQLLHMLLQASLDMTNQQLSGLEQHLMALLHQDQRILTSISSNIQ